MMNAIEESVAPMATFDVERIRRDFPVLQERVRGKELVYLEQCATTQKPLTVAYALQHYYTNENANIHRGVHLLSQQATFSYERALRASRAVSNARSRRLFFCAALRRLSTSWHTAMVDSTLVRETK